MYLFFSRKNIQNYFSSKQIQNSKSQHFIALAVPSNLNAGLKNPVSLKTMYALPVPELQTTEHVFPKNIAMKTTSHIPTIIL